MDFQTGHIGSEQKICDLFTATFSASEGKDEGAALGDFVRDMMDTTPSDDLYVWSAREGDRFAGCIFFSRMRYPQDDRTVFILSPLAIETAQQRTGIGQRLIAHGLKELRQKNVDVVLTYGDPRYYCKTGFQQITEEFAQPPLALSMPEGWLGQALAGRFDKPLIGPSNCVAALNKPNLW